MSSTRRRPTPPFESARAVGIAATRTRLIDGRRQGLILEDHTVDVLEDQPDWVERHAFVLDLNTLES